MKQTFRNIHNEWVVVTALAVNFKMNLRVAIR